MIALRALVVGASYAGLATAALLREAGCHVRLVAPLEEPRPDVGLVLHANAVSMLGLAGVGEALLASSAAIDTTVVHDVDGTPAHRVELAALGIGARGIRASTLRALLSARCEGIDLVESRLAALEQDERGIGAVLADGSRTLWDLVVGADGAGSTVRALAFADAGPRATGAVAHRALLLTSAVPREAIDVLGAGYRAQLWPVDGGLAALRIVGRGLAERRPEAHPFAACAALDGAVGEAFGRLVGAPVTSEPVAELPLARYASGRVVLVGDAAHAMPPDLALGVGAALEDARALALAVAESSSPLEALATYEELRRRRVDALRELSVAAARLTSGAGRAATAMRSLLLRGLPEGAVARRLAAVVEGGPEVRELASHRPELPPMSAGSALVVRLLLKIVQADRVLAEDERRFVQETLHGLGEHASTAELERLGAEVLELPLEDVARPLLGLPRELREQIARLAFFGAGADGVVAGPERAMVERLAVLLELDR